MVLTTVAVLPQPPLLVPELVTGAAAETTSLRAACLAAAARLGHASGRWIAVGADGGGRRTVEPAARGTFAAFGVDVPVALDTRRLQPAGVARSPDSRASRVRLAGGGVAPDVAMALPLLVAGWVAAAAGVEAVIRGELVAPDASPGECAALGARLAAECAAAAEPVGLLVIGDGAATHTEKAPGYLDERARPFDRGVAAALATADPAALAALNPVLAGELCAAGRAPWQVLAGATTAGRWRGELVYSEAPFGVAYHVAIWQRSTTGEP